MTNNLKKALCTLCYRKWHSNYIKIFGYTTFIFDPIANKFYIIIGKTKEEKPLIWTSFEINPIQEYQDLLNEIMSFERENHQAIISTTFYPFLIPHLNLKEEFSL